ncbi:AraC family transcriptional regulator [Bacteroides sp. K03]|uniref:helix-turn-helix domain-containing protein n=1 Tax=unclassified Bacteroides TaxID=2646097 RepID=UPI001C8CB35F|nr:MULTISPECIES: helix-turn-helix domain-containing protein [unclassified Bacteroides]MBX9186682.1 AraC family transcriptional regulator [Bacteroides sp. K03]
MNKSTEQTLWGLLENITENLKGKRLADVFRFISFYPSETYGPHKHLRIEINYVKKGNCILHLDDESVTFREGEIMIITSGISHLFEAGSEGTTLMQLEFLPEVFSHFNFKAEGETATFMSVTLFSEENRLIKIVNNVRIMRVVQRIVNELELKSQYYQYLVVMYYAELLILIYRYMDESYLPICTNDSLKKAIAYIRLNYQSEITMNDVAEYAGISERYLRRLFSQYLNLSPLDYLNQMRINRAIELLRNTEMSVKEICYLCGFRSPQYFSRIFKQQMGISPREVTK